MSFANLLPRAPWTPPHAQSALPASRNDQPARPYSKRQAARTSHPVAQPVHASQVAPLPEQGQGTMALVQSRNSSSVYSLLPLPRYEQHSAQHPPTALRGRPLRPADTLTRQLEGRSAGVAIAYLEIMSARRSRQQLAQWVSADCFHRLLPFFPKKSAPGAQGDAVDSSAGSVAGASAEGARGALRSGGATALCG